MMVEEKPDALPGSGYDIVRLYALEQHFETLAGNELADLEEDTSPLYVLWDWRITNRADLSKRLNEGAGDFLPLNFSIAFGIQVAGSQNRPERVLSNLVADFHLDSEKPTVPLHVFVKLHGPATMFPYVRENVSRLTSLSPRGSMHLPVANIRAMMDDLPLDSTTGWKQLVEHPDIADRVIPEWGKIDGGQE